MLIIARSMSGVNSYEVIKETDRSYICDGRYSGSKQSIIAKNKVLATSVTLEQAEQLRRMHVRQRREIFDLDKKHRQEEKAFIESLKATTE